MSKITKDDKVYYRERLTRARAQRFLALDNAFKTLDAFVIPSVSPDQLLHYDKLKEYLLKGYSDFDKKELKNYKF